MRYALAEAKARAVADRNIPQALVIGADQILVCADEWFDKPADLAAARRSCCRCAVAPCAGDRGLRDAIRRAALGLRERAATDDAALSAMPFLHEYIAPRAMRCSGSVGAYRLEGRGVQLFARIEGDHFAILGLPLMSCSSFASWSARL